MKKNKILILLIDLIFVIIILSLIFTNIKKNKFHQENELSNLNLKKQFSAQESYTLIKNNILEYNNYMKKYNFNSFSKINSDFIGWIFIEGTNIDYPLLKSRDNLYYLNHSFEKKYNPAGSIFLDYRNNELFKDQNTILYGHFMNDGSMFHDLKKFKDIDYAEKHKNITIFNKNKIMIYEIFSVYVTNEAYDYRTPNYKNINNFYNFYNRIDTLSLIDSNNYNIDENTKILTLSTCNDGFSDKRLAVHALLKKCIQLD